MTNAFDVDVLRFINQFAHHSPLFDGAVLALTSQRGWMVLVFWWIWFKPGKTNTANREIIVATLVSAAIAVVAGRLLAAYLPFRLRPLASPELGFVLPYGASADALRTWSSFPSDHAMVFFAMSTGLWFVSIPLGAVTSLFVLIIIALPRIYLGYHYPTDMIGGALLGIVFAYSANIGRIRTSVAAPAMKWERLHPASFYTFFFMFSEGLATLFDSLRRVALTFQSLLR